MAEELDLNMQEGGGDPPTIGQIADAFQSGQLTGASGPASSFKTSMEQSANQYAQENFAPPKMSLLESLTTAESPGTEYWNAEQVDKFIQQENFKGDAFSPGDAYNTQRAIDNETWGTAMGKAFDSAGYRFGNTFTDWWKDYGRMGDALLSMDWDKLRPDEQTLIDQYYQDQLDMNRNFVFASKEDEEGIFNKKFAADLISNSGFALGTFGALGVELAADAAITALTAGGGIASFGATFARLGAKMGVKKLAKEGVEAGVKSGFRFTDAISDIGRGFTEANQSVDAIRASAKVAGKADEAAEVAAATGRSFSARMQDTIADTFTMYSNNIGGMWRSKNFSEFAGQFVRGVPLLGTGVRYGEKIVAGAKAGKNAFELTGMGLQGVRRLAQEFNMSATEASFEAVTSYGDTLDKLVKDYKDRNNGLLPPEEEFEKFKQAATDTSASNYNTNLAILMVTNKLQFGNLFNRFTPANKVIKDLLEEGAERMLFVEGRDIATKKLLTQGYKKGFFGTYGVLGQISKDFGKKEAAYQVGKALTKDMLRMEVTEGLQENLQEMSSKSWQEYYMAKAQNAEKSLTEAFGEGFQEQFTKQGFKTFLMGAVTGSVIRIPTAATSRLLEKMSNAATSMQYKNDPAADPVKQAEKALDNDLKTLNAAFRQLSSGDNMSHKMFNFAAQTEAAQEMTAAAAQGKQYEFQNGKDNALLHAVLAAQRTNSVKAFESAIRNMGMEMSNEEFSKMMGVNIEDTKYSSAAEFSDSVARDVKKYSEVIEGVKRKVGQLADPFRYQEGSRDRYVAAVMRQVQDEAISVIAYNAIKGEMTVKRVQQLSNDIRSIAGIADSADYALRILTNPNALKAEIGNISADINILMQNMQAEGLTPEQKKDLEQQIADKKSELQELDTWTSWWSMRTTKNTVTNDQGQEMEEEIEEDDLESFIGKRKPGRKTYRTMSGERTQADGTTLTETSTVEEDDEFDMHDPEVFTNFARLMQLKNKQAGLDVDMNMTFPYQEPFQKIIDYMRLDKDAKEYMKAVDVLFNPENFEMMLYRMTDGNFKYLVMQYLDSVEELAQKQWMVAVMNLKIFGDSDSEKAERDRIREEIAAATFKSEEYRNLETIVLDPNAGVQMNKYAQEQVEKISSNLKAVMAKIYRRNISMEGYADLSDEQYENFKKDMRPSFQVMVRIANKLFDEIPLTSREQEVYDKYTTDIDEVVNDYKAAEVEATPQTETRVDDTENPAPAATPQNPTGPSPAPAPAGATPQQTEEEEEEEQPAAAAGPKYILAEDKYLGFSILDSTINDYWYDENGQSFWTKNRSEAEAKLAELNGGQAVNATPEQVEEGNEVMVQQIEEDILNGGVHIATGLQNASPEDRQAILDAIQAVSDKYPDLDIQVMQEPHRIVAKASSENSGQSSQEGQDSATDAKADTEAKYKREDFPDTQSNTRTPVTQMLLDYYAEVLGIPKFTEDLSKGTYISWLQKANPIGYAVADKLNAPKQAFDIIAEYNAELAALEQYAPVVKPEQTEPEEVDETEGVGESGAMSAAQLLRNKRQQRQQAAREESGDSFHTEQQGNGMNVVDNNGTPVNDQPLTEEQADELQQSLDRTRSELDVVYNYMTGATLTQKNEFHSKALEALARANAKRDTPFSSLEEFSKTPKGKSTLKGIATRILKKGTTQEAADAPVVVESPAGEDVPLFETTTTANAASLTFEDFVELDEKLAEFKAKANQDTQEISKFVEEDTSTKTEAPVTKTDLVNILRDIHACF